MKRLIDILFSLIIILAFSPIGLLIIIVLRITGEGEVFYKQYRVGKGGENFGMYKFATMVKNSPNIGAGDITVTNDPRVLPIGKVLRKFKLNEFPQFINVFIGDMSLVGPRPLVQNQYQIIPKKYKKNIKNLKPGITGIGSIIFRDEEKYLNDNQNNSNNFYRSEIIPYKASLECWYFENKSIFVDVVLIILTVLMIFSPSSKIYNYFFPNIPKHPLFNPI